MVAFRAEIGSVCNSFWSWFAARRYSFCGGSLLSWCADSKTLRSPPTLFQAHRGPAARGKTTGFKRTWHCKGDTLDLLRKGKSFCCKRRAKDIELLLSRPHTQTCSQTTLKESNDIMDGDAKPLAFIQGAEEIVGVFFMVWIFFYGSESYFLNANTAKLLSSFELDFSFAL